jgi:hypothetical protein
MADDREPEPKIIIDEGWKTKVDAEREMLRRQESDVKQEEPPAPAAEQPQTPFRIPRPTFASLVQHFATQALYSLGAAAEPETKHEGQDNIDPQTHLELARHLIDTLGLLQEKTRGNLTPEEAAGLEDTLHELRMAFVAVRSRGG